MSAQVFKMLSKKYSTPEKVQTFLKSIPYNGEEEFETCRSAIEALKKKRSALFRGHSDCSCNIRTTGLPAIVVEPGFN